jgi:CheY-like chemotaxis protein
MMIRSVLILDDEQSNLDLITHLIRPHIAADLVCAKHPTRAIQLAQEHCFDLILLDVTINYRGTPYGGLEVYKALGVRYGSSSILAYSQYIEDDLLEKYGLQLNFSERDINVIRWSERLVSDMNKLRSLQTCFVAMPFDLEFEPLYAVIKVCVEMAGYQCIRVDQQVFTKSIIDRIFEEIRKAKMVIFVASSKNPNVFYEAGYAMALDKEIIAITDEYSNLPFDVRDRSTLKYGADFSELKNPLQNKLASLTIVKT